MKSAFVLLFLTASSLSGATCIEIESRTLMYTTNCSSQPEVSRAFGGQIINWNGHNYLFTNTGNNLTPYLIDVPSSPHGLSSSDFSVPNVGDSDYDLLNFSVCDDCRYGIANYKAGTVLFDLGVGTTPSLGAFNYVSGANLSPGAFTFSHDNQQYLIASSLGEDCTLGNAGLARFSGTDTNDLEWIGCVEVPNYSGTRIVGGYKVGDYLYLGDESSRVFIMHIDDQGTDLALDFVSRPFFAYMIKDRGLAIDLESGIAVTANTLGMTVWDISDPANPVERGNASGYFNRAAVHCNVVWVARKGFKNSEQTFDISNLDAPEQLDQSFWDSENLWNYPSHECAEVQGGVFSPDGGILYLARYASYQLVDFASCVQCQTEPPDTIFTNGFELGNTSAWTNSTQP